VRGARCAVRRSAVGFVLKCGTSNRGACSPDMSGFAMSHACCDRSLRSTLGYTLRVGFVHTCGMTNPKGVAEPATVRIRLRVCCDRSLRSTLGYTLRVGFVLTCGASNREGCGPDMSGFAFTDDRWHSRLHASRLVHPRGMTNPKRAPFLGECAVVPFRALRTQCEGQTFTGGSSSFPSHRMPLASFGVSVTWNVPVRKASPL
jgi:hypothetical protein